MTEPTGTGGIATILGINIATFVAQVFGQLVSLSFMAPMTTSKRVTTVASGLVSAHYGTQMVLHFFPSLLHIEAAAGFSMGLLGMAIIKAAFDAVPKAFDRLLGRI